MYFLMNCVLLVSVFLLSLIAVHVEGTSNYLFIFAGLYAVMTNGSDSSASGPFMTLAKGNL